MLNLWFFNCLKVLFKRWRLYRAIKFVGKKHVECFVNFVKFLKVLLKDVIRINVLKNDPIQMSIKVATSASYFNLSYFIFNFFTASSLYEIFRFSKINIFWKIHTVLPLLRFMNMGDYGSFCNNSIITDRSNWIRNNFLRSFQQNLH